MSRIVIDVCGLACPEPLLAFERAAKSPEATELEIRFDCGAARDNISRAAPAAGWAVLSVDEEGDHTVMVLSKKV
jgi:Predicted redox protein, regulator of disulfide bond formation